MKKLFTIVGATLMSSALFAQNIYVHQNDGTAYGYDVADVEEINFSLGKSRLATPAPDTACEKRLNDPEYLLDALSGIISKLQESAKENESRRDSISWLYNEINKKNSEIETLKQKLAACGGECKEDTNAVDLGLSVKWASMNLGATKSTDMGTHYSWGEVTPFDDTYDFSGWTATELIEKGIMTADSILTPEHDAATVNWGSCWRMPTEAESKELVEKCTWEFVTVDGMKGCKVTGPNGNSIFLPAVGVLKPNQSSIPYIGDGYYWTSGFSNVNDSYGVSFLMFTSDETHRLHWMHTRYDGVLIRPVLK